LPGSTLCPTRRAWRAALNRGLYAGWPAAVAGGQLAGGESASVSATWTPKPAAASAGSRAIAASRRNRIRRREGLAPASKGTDRILIAEDEQRLKGA
jgi:hypothetical protein